MPELAKQKISKELAMGRIAGPFSVPPSFFQLYVFLGLFTLKINAETLSLPPALSVNKQIVSLEVHTLSSITVIPL
jgi:hypothetical protein